MKLYRKFIRNLVKFEDTTNVQYLVRYSALTIDVFKQFLF